MQSANRLVAENMGLKGLEKELLRLIGDQKKAVVLISRLYNLSAPRLHMDFHLGKETEETRGYQQMADKRLPVFDGGNGRFRCGFAEAGKNARGFSSR